MALPEGERAVKLQSNCMNVLKNHLRRALGKIYGLLGISKLREDVAVLRQVAPGVAKESQLLLQLAYQQRKFSGARMPSLNDVEFRTFSQNGEDGILWYIFSLIGATNKRAVEICAGDGIQCNTANLIVNHGWSALLFDGDPDNVSQGNEFFRKHPDTFTFPPVFVNAWIDTENVNRLIESNGFSGEIDLLSLDIDGIDYWLWKAIEVVRPRVVVAEVQAIWGDTRSVTVPYRSDFKAEYIDGFGIYSGASLPAFVKLAQSKGYRLIGTQRYGFNAFFLRNDIGKDIFREVTAAEAMQQPFAKWARETFLPKVMSRDWTEV